LHLVDLDGAKKGAVMNWKVVEQITSQTKLEVDFGGGIKTAAEITRLLEHGVRQVNIGSIAVKNPALVLEWLETYGGNKIILSADVKDELVQINGWLDNSSIHIESLIKTFLKGGLTAVACTDISTDGMLMGPNIKLYKKLIAKFPAINLIASGGVSNLQDLIELKETGVAGVIIGKAIYEGRITLDELKKI
jgi:phosphoribosylformimino-5-aminoimidazole carboxamide ribotide isomerase